MNNAGKKTAAKIITVIVASGSVFTLSATPATASAEPPAPPSATASTEPQHVDEGFNDCLHAKISRHRDASTLLAEPTGRCSDRRFIGHYDVYLPHETRYGQDSYNPRVLYQITGPGPVTIKSYEKQPSGKVDPVGELSLDVPR